MHDFAKSTGFNSSRLEATAAGIFRASVAADSQQLDTSTTQQAKIMHSALKHNYDPCCSRIQMTKDGGLAEQPPPPPAHQVVKVKSDVAAGRMMLPAAAAAASKQSSLKCGTTTTAAATPLTTGKKENRGVHHTMLSQARMHHFVRSLFA